MKKMRWRDYATQNGETRNFGKFFFFLRLKRDYVEATRTDLCVHLRKMWKRYRMYLFFLQGATVRSGPGSPHYRGFTTTLRHTTLDRTRADRPVAETCTWHHTTLTSDNLLYTPRKGVATDPRLRQCGLDRHIHLIIPILNLKIFKVTLYWADVDLILFAKYTDERRAGVNT